MQGRPAPGGGPACVERREHRALEHPGDQYDHDGPSKQVCRLKQQLRLVDALADRSVRHADQLGRYAGLPAHGQHGGARRNKIGHDPGHDVRQQARARVGAIEAEQLLHLRIELVEPFQHGEVDAGQRHEEHGDGAHVARAEPDEQHDDHAGDGRALDGGERGRGKRAHEGPPVRRGGKRDGEGVGDCGACGDPQERKRDLLPERRGGHEARERAQGIERAGQDELACDRHARKLPHDDPEEYGEYAGKPSGQGVLRGRAAQGSMPPNGFGIERGGRWFQPPSKATAPARFGRAACGFVRLHVDGEVKIVLRHGAADRLGARGVKHLEVTGQRIFHLLAGEADEMAVGDGRLRDGLGLDDARFDHEGSRGGRVVVDRGDRGRLRGQELDNRLLVRLGELAAHHGHAGDHLAALVGVLCPHVGQVDRRAQRIVLGERGGHERLGQHAHGGCVGGQRADDLGRFALELERDGVGDAGGVQQVVHGVLGGRPLAGEIDGAAGKILEGGDGRVSGHHGQHAERVDVDARDALLGLVIQDRGGVRRDEGDVDIALDDLRQDLVCGLVDIERVGVVVALGVLGELHEGDEADGRGAGEGRDADLDALDGFFLGASCGARGASGRCRAGTGRGVGAPGESGDGAGDAHARCSEEGAAAHRNPELLGYAFHGETSILCIWYFGTHDTRARACCVHYFANPCVKVRTKRRVQL